MFLAEYRGYGGLAGEPSESGLFADAAAAVQAVYASGVSQDRVAIVGRSLGTGVAVEMARRGHGRALVLVSPYTNMPDVARSLVGPLTFLVADKFDSLARIKEVQVPITVIHGTNDAVVPFALGERLALAARARLVVVRDRGHNDLDNLPALIDEAVRAAF
ncbi:MAG: alpha/beta hydrolase [Deltaproteobacteria bacterium]|nr:alpha/beta hydrolase [Deltaproteobacteria bacterium]